VLKNLKMPYPEDKKKDEGILEGLIVIETDEIGFDLPLI
jgi:hypothetical protein